MKDSIKMSSTEAEYCELSIIAKAIIYFENLIDWIAGYDARYKRDPDAPSIIVDEDNQGALDTSNSAGNPKKLRHL